MRLEAVLSVACSRVLYAVRAGFIYNSTSTLLTPHSAYCVVNIDIYLFGLGYCYMDPL